MKGNVVGQGGIKVNGNTRKQYIYSVEALNKGDLVSISKADMVKNKIIKSCYNANSFNNYIETASTSQSGNISCVNIEPNKVLTFYRGSSPQYPKAHIATFIPNTISHTMGAEVNIESVVCITSNVVLLTPTKAVAIYEASSLIKAKVLNISGTTITVATTAYTVGSTPDKSTAFRLSDTKFIVFYRQSSVAYYSIGTVTGDVISFSTPVNWSALNIFDVNYLPIDENSGIVIHSVYNSGSGIWDVYAKKVTISGNTVTFLTQTAIGTGYSSLVHTSSWLKIGVNFLAIYRTSTETLQRVCTISDNTITAETSYINVSAMTPVKSVTISENAIFVSWSTTNSPAPITVFSNSDIRQGTAGTLADPTSIGKDIVKLNDTEFLQAHGGNGTPIRYSFIRAVKDTIGIANQTVSAGQLCECQMF